MDSKWQRLIQVCVVSLFVGVTMTAAAATQATGKVVGSVLDEFNGMSLPMAPVAVEGTDTVVFTDLDGTFQVELPAGAHQLKFSFSGYEDRVVNVDVLAGKTAKLDVAMSLTRFQEEVTVTAEAETPQLFTTEAQLVERKRATVIEDNLAAEDMRKNADGDAAAAMQRVTGVSVVDNQYIFVRGLGERYSNTQLNGATLPTTEPDKSVVPLDLFPTGMIQNVSVVKTFTPDLPGNFTGGLVTIDPLSFPETQVFDFSVAQGFNSQTTFETYSSYPGGGTDWLGFDDGTRALPSIIPADAKVVRGNEFTGRGFTRDELQTFGRSFSNVWEAQPGSSAPQNQAYSLVYGNSWDNLGAVFSFTYNYKNQNLQEEQNFYKVSGDSVALQNDYDFTITENSTTMGMVGNIAYKLNGNNQISFDNFFTNNSSDETRFFEGFNNDLRSDIRNTRLYWVEEKLYSGKVAGEHYLPSVANSRIDWRTTFSRATRDEPDLREVMYELDQNSGNYVLADESQSGFRMFNDMLDNVYEFGLDWSFYTTQWGGLPAMVKVGPYMLARDRDFASRRFRYRPIAPGQIDITQPPEVIFAPENIGSYYELREETRNTDAYTADQTVTAGYMSIDLPLSDRWRFVGGARVERSEQSVNTLDAFSVNPTEITSNLDNTDVLPGLNLIYAVKPDQNLRFGYSHSVNRPEFRELAPFEFTDVIGGRAVVGNPDLQRALIKNMDVRWEWFSGPGEVIAASFFYKDFSNPIERVVEPTAQLRTSFANAESATNTGIELEARKRLAPWLFASMNYTFVDSTIDIGRDVGQVQTSTERPLAGQSQNILNAMVEYENLGWNFSARAVYNYFGDRIIDVGSLGLPDILEEGRGTLDLIFIKRFLERAQLRFVFDNVTNAQYLFTQGGEVQRLFQRGRTFTLSFSYSVY